MTGKEVLDLPMDENDAEAKTVRDYLKALLRHLWHEQESFSGKRPFGNSGWEYELYRAPVKAGLVKGDEDGDPADAGEKSKAHALIYSALEALQ